MIDLYLDDTAAKKFAQLMQRIVQQFPREANRAMGRTVSIVRGQMRAVMRVGGGINGVPAFAPYSPLTLALNAWGKQRRRLGGKLAEPAFIQMWLSNGVQYVGWVDSFTRYGEWFQQARHYLFSNAQKHAFHFRLAGAYDSVMTEYYSRPARDVIYPLRRHVERKMPEWFLGNLRKLVDEKLKKVGF